MTDNSDSQTVRAGSNTYFFDLKETDDGKPFLVITQSRFKGEGKGHDRASLAIFPETANEFLETAQDMLKRLT
jgi:hypothetical protein